MLPQCLHKRHTEHSKIIINHCVGAVKENKKCFRKEKFHHKIKLLSLFPHPHVIPKIYAVIFFSHWTQMEVFVRKSSENILCSIMGKNSRKYFGRTLDWIGTHIVFYFGANCLSHLAVFYLNFISKPVFRNDKLLLNTWALAHEDLLIVAVEMAETSNILKAY